MIRVIRLILSRIPKKGIAVIASPFTGVVADRLYESYVSQKPFVGWPRILPALSWTLGILAVYFLLEFLFQITKYASGLESQMLPDSKEVTDTRQSLPISEVSIGTYKEITLAIDILAKIVLGERSKPSMEVFLHRIILKDPYCPKCQRTLDTTHASWMADGVQIGYACRNCHTDRRGVKSDLYKDVAGEVRRNFDRYWQKYCDMINELTDGKPQDFKVE